MGKNRLKLKPVHLRGLEKHVQRYKDEIDRRVAAIDAELGRLEADGKDGTSRYNKLDDAKIELQCQGEQLGTFISDVIYNNDEDWW